MAYNRNNHRSSTFTSNIIEASGNLGSDPKVISGENSSTTCVVLTVACNASNEVNGEEVTATRWHRVKLFGKNAELAAEYLTKGVRVRFRGREFPVPGYTNANGEYIDDVFEINAEWIAVDLWGIERLLGEGGDNGRTGQPQRSRSRSTRQRRSAASSAPSADVQEDVDEEFEDDDIPDEKPRSRSARSRSRSTRQRRSTSAESLDSHDDDYFGDEYLGNDELS